MFYNTIKHNDAPRGEPRRYLFTVGLERLSLRNLPAGPGWKASYLSRSSPTIHDAASCGVLNPQLPNKAVHGGVIGLVWNVMPTAAGLVYMERQLAEAGHVLMLGASGVNGKNEDKTIRRLAANGMAGLIITPAREGVESSALELWVKNGDSVVFHGHPGRWILPEKIV